MLGLGRATVPFFGSPMLLTPPQRRRVGVAGEQQSPAGRQGMRGGTEAPLDRLNSDAGLGRRSPGRSGILREPVAPTSVDR
jgi:hypothetical protein